MKLIRTKDHVYRDKEGRIIAWLVGMTKEDEEELIEKNPGCYLSNAKYDTERGITI